MLSVNSGVKTRMLLKGLKLTSFEDYAFKCLSRYVNTDVLKSNVVIKDNN